MNLGKLVSVAKLLLLLVCCLPQYVSARSIAADLVILHILKNIIKPRFVPLPIPLPLPIKFTKHTHKAYPVPHHGHSLSAYPVAASPLSFHLGGGYDSFGVGHGLSSLAHHSSGHDLASYSHLSSAHELSDLSHLATGHELAGLSHLSSGHEFSALTHIPTFSEPPPKVPEEVLKLLEKLDELEKLKSEHLSSSLSTSLDHSSELLHDNSNKLDSVHDDIHAIGGFDLLDDLHGLSSKHEWLK